MKKQILFVAACLSLALSTTAAAEETKGCLSEGGEMMIRNYRVNLGQKRPADWACQPTNRYYRIAEALEFVENTWFQAPYPPYPYNLGIHSDSMGGDFANAGLTVGWGGADRSCGDALAFTPVSESRTRIMICPMIFKPQNPYQGDVSLLLEPSVVTLAGVLVHEHRHQQGVKTGFAHVACHGVSQGCDPSVDYKGAFAAEMEFYAKVGKSAPDVHPALKEYAREQAYTIGMTNFKKKPDLQDTGGHSVEFLVLQKKDGTYVYQDDNRERPAFSGVPVGKALLVGDGNYMAVFSEESSQAKPKIFRANDFNAAFSRPMGQDETPFDVAALPDQGAVGDLESVSLWLNSGLTYIASSDRVLVRAKPYGEQTETQGKGWASEVLIPAGRVTSVNALLFVNGDSNEASGINVMTDAGHLYSLAVMKDRSVKLTEIQHPFAKFQEAVQKQDGSIFLLDSEGRLYRAKSAKDEAVLVTEFANSRYRHILFTRFDSRLYPAALGDE